MEAEQGMGAEVRGSCRQRCKRMVFTEEQPGKGTAVERVTLNTGHLCVAP